MTGKQHALAAAGIVTGLGIVALGFTMIWTAWWTAAIVPAPQPVQEANPGVNERFNVDVLWTTGAVSSMSISPDGRHIAAGTRGAGVLQPKEEWEGDLRIWEIATKKQVFFGRFDQWVKRVEFSGDGKLLAVVCSSAKYSAPEGFLGFVQKPGAVRVFSFPEMKELKCLEFKNLVESLHFSSDGHRLAIACSPDLHQKASWNRFEVVLLDWQDGGNKATIEKAQVSFVDAPPAMFSADGKEVVVGKRTNIAPENEVLIGVHVHDAQSGRFLREAGAGESDLSSKLAFHGGMAGDPTTADRSRSVSAEYPNRVDRTKIFWHNGPDSNLLVYTGSQNCGSPSTAYFSPVDPNLFAVGLESFRGLHDDRPTKSGAVLLFRYRANR